MEGQNYKLVFYTWAHRDAFKYSINAQFSARQFITSHKLFRHLLSHTLFHRFFLTGGIHLKKSLNNEFQSHYLLCIYRLLKCTKFLQILKFWRKLGSIWSWLFAFRIKLVSTLNARYTTLPSPPFPTKVTVTNNRSYPRKKPGKEQANVAHYNQRGLLYNASLGF